jgi:hypothetical protein
MMQTNSVTEPPKAKFWTGSLYFTAAAEKELPHEDILLAFERHQIGDWGDLCADDKEANENALQYGGRLFSAYHDRKGVKFWIITEADRRITDVEIHISDLMLSLQKC